MSYEYTWTEDHTCDDSSAKIALETYKTHAFLQIRSWTCYLLQRYTQRIMSLLSVKQMYNAVLCILLMLVEPFNCTSRNIRRSLARMGLGFLDITGVTAVGEYKHNPRSLIEGVIWNRVEETLGPSKYNKICKKGTVLENIHYCLPSLMIPEALLCGITFSGL